MDIPKYKITYRQGTVVFKAVKAKKRSYRDIAKRKFNAAVLSSLISPEETIKEIEFWKRYAGTKHYDKLIGMLSTALEVSQTMKREFLRLGKSFRLSNYAPYTNDIKKYLFKLNQLELF